MFLEGCFLFGCFFFIRMFFIRVLTDGVFIRAPSTGGLHPQPKILSAMFEGGALGPRSPFFGQNVYLKSSFLLE